MIKISFFYPLRPGMKFDMDYYVNRHIPMAIECLGAHSSFRGVSVERGVEPNLPGVIIPYVTLCHFYFDSLEDFLSASAPHVDKLQNDIPNYSEIPPQIQMSEVVFSYSPTPD